MFCKPVLETRHGGSGGGSARLTSCGRAVIDHYRAIEAQSTKLASKQLDELEQSLNA